MVNVGEIALVSLGAIIGTLWWLVFIVVILPRMFKKYGTYIEDRTVERVKKEIEPFSSKIEESVEGKIKEFSGVIEGKVNDIIDGYIADIINPSNEKPNLLIGSIVGRSWAMIRQNPEFNENFNHYVDRKIDYVINHLIKRIAEDPELMKKLMGAWQANKGASGGKGDIFGLLQSFMGGQMPGFG